MIDIEFDDVTLTTDLELWKKNNAVHAANYEEYPLTQMILDFEGLHKLIRDVGFDGYMLSPVWFNKTFKIEAKTRVCDKFETITETFKALRQEGHMVFLMSFFFCPDLPIHSLVDPNTFELKILDEVKMTSNAHWKIRYGILEPIQPKLEEESSDSKIKRIQNEFELKGYVL